MPGRGRALGATSRNDIEALDTDEALRRCVYEVLVVRCKPLRTRDASEGTTELATEWMLHLEIIFRRDATCNGLPAPLLLYSFLTARGNSSVGRAQPCQGWGREFESRFPLQYDWPQPAQYVLPLPSACGGTFFVPTDNNDPRSLGVSTSTMSAAPTRQHR
jgi:hypothetical protein